MDDTNAGQGSRDRRRLRVDGVLAVCVVVLVGFPLAAVVAGAGQPVTPRQQGAPAPLGSPRPGPALRDLPILAGGAPRPAGRTALRAAVSRASAQLLGAPAALRLLRLLDGPALPAPAGVSRDAYPYRYRRLTRLLATALPEVPAAGQVRAASALGSLLVLAADAGAYRNAGQGAFALLERIRAAAACDAQLTLAFLVAAAQTAEDHVEAELGAADAACPRDPTALWLHGQWVSIMSRSSSDAGIAPALFTRLQRRFPGAAAGWSGAADDLLRLAYVDDDAHRPFTARNRFRRALALYRRARVLDRAPELAAGEARALAGLGRFGDAARIQAGAARATGRPAALQARLVEYLERAHRFADAAPEARRLAAGPRFPRGTALFFPAGSEPPELDAEDALEPVSLGAGRLKPVALEIEPAGGTQSTGSATTVEDTVFIPLFRPVAGVTGVDRWCPAWAARRDLVLAGRPAAALDAIPASFRLVNPDPELAQEECVDADGRAALAAVARALTRDARGAGAAPRLQDDLQNLWRFAGRWQRASAQTAAWMRAAPRDRLAYDQAGEVAFLRGRFTLAARLFGRSAQLTREQTAGWSPAEAQELVKQGTALKRAGRLTEALAALAAGDVVASRSLAAHPSDDLRGPKQSLLYHARAQTADVLLRRHRYADAIIAYDGAREFPPAAATDDGRGGGRIEVLDNNEAITEIYAGHAERGLRLAQRALTHDRMNPIFLQTAGFALARLDRPGDASELYRRAVRSDPTLFPAWNDLGVMLARVDRDGAAVAALRRAVGARPSYALGWFNLGVVLERAGPQHALAAQGALARALRLDGELADRRHRLVTDEHLYITNLDLSKPLPPTWDFASSQTRWPLPAAGLALALLLGLQAARAAAARGLVGGTPKWVEAARDLLSRVPGALTTFAPSAVAVLATLAVFLWPAAHGNDAGLVSILLLAAGLAALVTAVMRARVLAARRAGVSVSQRAWRPAILVGAAAAVTGVPWAPLPVADPEQPTPGVHLSGPAVAAAAGLVLLVLGVWLQVPVTRALGVAALVMAASMLTPVAPLDGARLEKGTGLLTTGLALAATVGLVAVGLL